MKTGDRNNISPKQKKINSKVGQVTKQWVMVRIVETGSYEASDSMLFSLSHITLARNYGCPWNAFYF